MIYELKDCRTGNAAAYKTTVEITENNGILRFFFDAKHTAFYCPYSEYNKIHSEGDACEVLIGSDPDRKVYYEIEISANGDLMLAKMTYHGVDEKNNPVLDLDFVSKSDCFLKSAVHKTADGYTAEVSFPVSAIKTGNAPVFFNAYRLETDGGEMDKHLFALIPTLRPKFHAPSYFVELEKFV